MGIVEGSDTLSYFDPNEIFMSTSQPPTQNVVCRNCGLEFYNVVPGWRFTAYVIPCPYCGVKIGVDDR